MALPAKHVAFGGDLATARLGLGTMSLTGPGVWGLPRDPDEARRLLRLAREQGVSFFDTADSYGPGASERLVAESLHPYDGLVVATKGGLTRQGPGRWDRDCRPEHLRSACEASLRRLRVGRIDLYQLHAVDPDVPIEESVGALAELQSEGKIRHVGVCNVSASDLERALTVIPVVSVQNRFSLVDQTSRALVTRCTELGLAFIPWAPLAKGALAGRRSPLARLAQRHDATPAQIALAWLLHLSPVVVPIPGTSSAEHLSENLRGSEIALDPMEVDELSRLRFPVHRSRHAVRRLRVELGRLRRAAGRDGR